MRTNPTGEQWTIRSGDDIVTVVEVGGGVRSWTHEGVEMLGGYAADEECRSGRGQVLLPWPNRIRDGRYSADGRDFQLPLTEPKLGNASHGLVRFATWQVIEKGAATITVRHELHPQPGWAWQLDCEQTYLLGDDGLTVSATVTNVGPGTAPFGYGAHPYVAIGDAALADVDLHVPAEWFLPADERMLPGRSRNVDGTDRDFRERHAVGETQLDTAYTELHREDGNWSVVVDGPDRPEMTVWGDASFPWVQVFTGRAGTGEAGQRGIAVEPMTCPPDAFNSGTDLIRLQSGEMWTGAWGLRITEDDRYADNPFGDDEPDTLA